jgi:tellurite resistance protein TerC
VLVFVGAKMALVDVIKIPSAVSLLAIDTMLGTAIVASLWASRPKKEVRET